MTPFRKRSPTGSNSRRFASALLHDDRHPIATTRGCRWVRSVRASELRRLRKTATPRMSLIRREQGFEPRCTGVGRGTSVPATSERRGLHAAYGRICAGGNCSALAPRNCQRPGRPGEERLQDARRAGSGSRHRPAGATGGGRHAATCQGLQPSPVYCTPCRSNPGNTALMPGHMEQGKENTRR